MPNQTIDFDHHSAEFGEKSTEILSERRGECPLGFSKAHGGYWSVFAHRTGIKVFQDAAHFSVCKYTTESGEVKGGLAFPTIESLDLIPGEVDPPQWNGYRKLLNPVFSPAAVDRLRPRIRVLFDELIDEFFEAGEADLVLDLANLGPALVTVDFLGLQRSDLELFSDPFHKAMWAPAGSPEWGEAIDGFARIPAVVLETVQARRAEPTDDYISELVSMELEGRTLSDDELIKILVQLLAGGIDSTAALLANVFIYLDDEPELRTRLLEDEKFLQRATEEFVRYFTPIQSIARTSTEDVALEEAEIEGRQPVVVWMASMNRDSEVFDRPDEVVPERWPNRHAGFGIGAHRCLGSNLARAMFQIGLTQVLRRIPDYRIDRERTVPYGSKAQVNGWVKVPATFTPAPRVAAG